MFPIRKAFLLGRVSLLPSTVFASSAFSGNGSTQTITNGIDLLGKGGLVWGKSRSDANSHEWVDTVRGAGNRIRSDATAAQAAISDLTAFTASGFTLGFISAAINSSGTTSVTWSFAKSPNFFDIVSYTGTGGAQTIAHSLGVAPGMVIVKKTNAAANWTVWHRGLTSGNYIFLNLTNAQSATGTETRFGDTSVAKDPDTANFYTGGGQEVGGSGQSYIAYLFAHDPSGIIQCGSFTSQNGGSTVTLGWQPQYLMIKRTSSSAGWLTFDTARTWTTGNDRTLSANTSSAEDFSVDYCNPISTGFTENLYANYGSSDTFVYMAIKA